ncbi:MAG: hypothetical protein HYY18_06210 [Planctomycetes bacterium]|nr:hypothetical protein [Planctomycetota bacterium]
MKCAIPAFLALAVFATGCGKEDDHSGHNHGKDAHGGTPVKVESKGFDDSIAQMEARLASIDALVASGKLDEVHKDAEAIQKLAEGLPEHAKGFAAEKATAIGAASKELAGFFAEIDEAADNGKKDETVAVVKKMKDLVARLKGMK